MIAKSNPKLSDWSMSEFDDQTSKSPNANKPLKTSTLMSPCFFGLILGILSNGITITVVITVWIKSFQPTDVVITNEFPPGTILLYGGNLSQLNGSTFRWLLCDGSEVSRLIYRDLFDVIGVTYGMGNGNDTFNLPDLRGRFALGRNGSNDSQLVSGGSASHVLTVNEMPSHNHDQGSLTIDSSGSHSHPLIDPGHNHGGSTGNSPYVVSGYGITYYGYGTSISYGDHSHSISNGMTGITMQTDGIHTHSLQGMTGSQGGNQAIDMMPPYQTFHYIIRA